MAIKSMLKKAYGDCEGPLGLPMKSDLAKELETLMKGLPQECREYGLKRFAYIPKKLDFDEEARTDVSTITNEAIDRDNEVIIASGIDWKQFKKGGGPVMFAHDYTMLPVGRSPWVIKIKGESKSYQDVKAGWKAQTFYHTRVKGWDGPWLPDAIVGMIGEGGLKGKSIGFIPKEFSSPKPEEIKRIPEWEGVNFIIRKSIAIEYSVAPIPSNPEAIVSGKSYAKDLTDLALEHMGIFLPSGFDTDFFKIQESSLQEETKKYKVITQPSVSARLLKALRGK